MGRARSYSQEAVAFLPDGKTLVVTARDEGAVELFDVETGRIKRRFDVGVGISGVAISNDGRTLAATGWGSAIRLWALPEGTRLGDQFAGHDQAVYEVTFTMDGRHVVTACSDETARIWEASTGRHLRRLGAQRRINSVAVSSDQTRILSSGFDDTVRLWDMPSGREIFRLPGHGQEGKYKACALAFDHAKARFLSFGPNLHLRIRDLRTGKALAEHVIRPSGIEFEEEDDGKLRLAESSADFDWGRRVTGVVQYARFNASTDRLLLCDGRSIYVFDTETGREIGKLTPEDSLRSVTGFRLSADGKALATVERRRSEPDPAAANPEESQLTYLLKVYRWPSQEKIAEIELESNVGHALALSADGRLAATGIRVYEQGELINHWISVWEVETGNEAARIDGRGGRIQTIAFSPDGQRLASTHNDTTTLVWDLSQFRVEGPPKE